MRSVLLIMIAACSSSSSLPSARFTNSTPVRAVNDRQDVAAPPEEREYMNSLYHFDGSFRDPLLRPFEVEKSHRARGVNAVDEVPDSSWFTNRIGVRDLTPDEIRKGQTTIDNPELHLPWTVISKKSAGVSLGFIILDARGEKFLVKFDPKRLPELETSSHVITSRLLWAAGYNVTEDFIARVPREDFRVDPKAEWTDDAGKHHRLSQADIDDDLADVYRANDGRIRVMASRWLPGRTLGGHPDHGVRRDDPNDRIPHELRRDLRGVRAIFAWLDNVDVKESNTADVWVPDPRNPGRHYVRHYWLDFGRSLGTMAKQSHDQTRAYEYALDGREMFGSLISLGTKPNEWSGRSAPDLVGVGLFERDLDPQRWKPYTPAYRPLREADRFDWFWAAKIILRFTPAQLRAAVEAGELSDPRAVDYLVDALNERRRLIAHYAFEQVQPIDNVAVDTGSAICFDDLQVVHHLSPGPSSYQITTYDRAGRRLDGTRSVGATPSGRMCTGQLPLAGGRDRYTIYRIQTPGAAGETFVHVARDGSKEAVRVIGIWRE